MKFNLKVILAVLFAILCISCSDENQGSQAQNNQNGEEIYITLLTTTSTVDSGLLDYLNPQFQKETGISVRVVALGTGAALEGGRNGDGDVLLVHDTKAELEFVKEGYGVDRRDVMYNDFILLGPPDNPAGIVMDEPAAQAFMRIRADEHQFVSRGDDSGTNRKELSIWGDAFPMNDTISKWWNNPPGDWYKPVGQSMGATLTVADEMGAYVLVDRGTYIARRDNLNLVIVNEGDPSLRNNYGIMIVNPEKHEHVRYDDSLKYVDWMTSEKGKEMIESFRKDGEIFFKAARPE